jgi:hypothetical protein
VDLQLSLLYTWAFVSKKTTIIKLRVKIVGRNHLCKVFIFSFFYSCFVFYSFIRLQMLVIRKRISVNPQRWYQYRLLFIDIVTNVEFTHFFKSLLVLFNVFFGIIDVLYRLLGFLLSSIEFLIFFFEVSMAMRKYALNTRWLPDRRFICHENICDWGNQKGIISLLILYVLVVQVTQSRRVSAYKCLFIKLVDIFLFCLIQIPTSEI